MALREQRVTALAANRSRDGGSSNGNGHSRVELTLIPSTPPPAASDVEAAALGDSLARPKMGWRGWLRAWRIARVLGTLNLYLFLENYEAQAKFSERMSARRLEEARAEGGARLRRAQRLELLRRVVDRLIRAVRRVVFRGADASESK